MNRIVESDPKRAKKYYQKFQKKHINFFYNQINKIAFDKAISSDRLKIRQRFYPKNFFLFLIKNRCLRQQF